MATPLKSVIFYNDENQEPIAPGTFAANTVIADFNDAFTLTAQAGSTNSMFEAGLNPTDVFVWVGNNIGSLRYTTRDVADGADTVVGSYTPINGLIQIPIDPTKPRGYISTEATPMTVSSSLALRFFYRMKVQPDMTGSFMDRQDRITKNQFGKIHKVYSPPALNLMFKGSNHASHEDAKVIRDLSTDRGSFYIWPCGGWTPKAGTDEIPEYLRYEIIELVTLGRRENMQSHASSANLGLDFVKVTFQAAFRTITRFVRGTSGLGVCYSDGGAVCFSDGGPAHF